MDFNYEDHSLARTSKNFGEQKSSNYQELKRGPATACGRICDCKIKSNDKKSFEDIENNKELII